MTGRLGELLNAAEVPESAVALEATIATAQATVATGPAAPVADGEGAPRERPRGRRRRSLALAGVAALLGVALLTPPGQAALSGAADLIGQIGGTPVSDGEGGLESSVPPGQPGSPLVVDNGEAPDGSRYEWVAFRHTERLPRRVAPRVKSRDMDMFCIRFAWADAPRRKATGGCGSLGSWSPGVIHMRGRLIRPAGDSGQRDYMLIGDVDPRVGRVGMVYRRPGGARYEMPVDLGRVDGKLMRQVGGDKPFTTLTAFIPGDMVAADRLDERHRPMGLSVVDPTFPMFMPYSSAYQRCVRRHGGFYERGWIDVTLYDRRDRRVATLPTRTARPRVAACKGIPMAPASGLTPGPTIVETPAFKRLRRAFPPRHPPVFKVR
jgi:hypothetical protein